jgi:hypothetical protein
LVTWDEVRAHLRQVFDIADENAARMTLIWCFPDGVSKLLQWVEVELETILGQPWLVLSADVLPVAELSPRQAMRRRAALAFGALVEREEMYILRHALPLDGLAWTTLDRALDETAREAAWLAAHSEPRRQPPPKLYAVAPTR